MRKYLLALMLGATALPAGAAQAMCWMPDHWGGLEEQLYAQCQEQERLADAIERQNQLIERQRRDEYDRCVNQQPPRVCY